VTLALGIYAEAPQLRETSVKTRKPLFRIFTVEFPLTNIPSSDVTMASQTHVRVGVAVVLSRADGRLILGQRKGSHGAGRLCIHNIIFSRI
jgi:hypothetical protein